MTVTVAEVTLWIALPVSIWGGVLAFLGGKWGQEGLVLAGERTVYVVFALLLGATAGLTFALVGDRFDLAYVHAHSSRNLEAAFKVAALWAGRQGALLFWALNLGFLSALAVRLGRRRDRALSAWVAGTLLGAVAFLLVVILFMAPPFQGLDVVPPEGQGLDAGLQSRWAVVQPPLLFLGLAAAAVPFAFAVAALVSGRLGGGWLPAARGWILGSWLLLTLGIVAGMRWAYEARGWEGSWFLDPVENASLIPWILSGVLLHSPGFRSPGSRVGPWSVGLLCLVFLTTVPAAFLAGSGLPGSGRPFPGDPVVASVLLGFVGVAGGACLVLILWRLPFIREAEGTGGEAPPGLRLRWGEHIAHLGAALVVVGLLGLPFRQEAEETLLPGDSMTVRSPFGTGYTLTYQGLSTHQGRNAWHLIALLTVSREGTSMAPLTPERRAVFLPPGPVIRPGLRSRHPFEDLYAVMVGLDEAVGTGNLPEHQGATFRVLVNPLVPWVWYGGLLLALGGLVSFRSGAAFPRSAPGGTLGEAGAGSRAGTGPTGARNPPVSDPPPTRAGGGGA